MLSVLEVCQFARDASVAEAWLIAQEPYVTSRDLGQSVDEVEKLLKRHEAFEKSTATWEERFSALERLTTVRKVPGQHLRSLFLETLHTYSAAEKLRMNSASVSFLIFRVEILCFCLPLTAQSKA